MSWKLLAQVELVKVKDRFQPQFSAGVAALDAKEVKVQGFMMPLEMGDKQSHFILAADAGGLRVLHAGRAGEPGRSEDEDSRSPTASRRSCSAGKLAVLKDDPTGVFYRLTDAVPGQVDR